MATSNRAAQTERAYRNQVRDRLIELMKVMNPQDVLQFGAMKYEELVEYARDWLNTELLEVSVNLKSPKSDAKVKDLVAQPALSLDLD